MRPEQKGDRCSENDLQFEQVRELRELGAPFITGYGRGGPISHKAGGVFLRQAAFSAVEPKTVGDRGWLLFHSV